MVILNAMTRPEFLATFGKGMKDVTDTAEPVTDIWEYVDELVEAGAVDRKLAAGELVSSVYRNDTATYDHVLLPMADKNRFMVIVVDLIMEEVEGHFLLDLNAENGSEGKE